MHYYWPTLHASDPSLWPFAATVLAAAITALVAVAIYVANLIERARDRKREMCAHALADALAWLELPYRIRRRTSDSPDTLTALAGRAHNLQEQLLLHSSWLRIELPKVAPLYDALLASVKSAAADPLTDAWRSPPVQDAGQMNTGPALPLLPANEVAAFCDSVRRSLALRPWSKGQ